MSTKTKTTKRDEKQEEVLRLKRTMNPVTGLPYSYAEIAERMGVTPMTPHRYIPKPLRDRCCPQCLRELIIETQNQKP